MKRLSGILSIALTVTVVVVAPASGWAQAAPDGHDAALGASASPHLPQLQVRAIVGTLVGAELEYTLKDRLRLRVTERVSVWSGLDPRENNFTDASAYVRLVGQPHNALWARAGYQYQRLSVHCWDRPDDYDDRAHAFDFGLAYRYQSTSGHLVETELGPEILRRKRGLGCNDSGVDASSSGLRASVLGQFAVSPQIGLFARLGVRSADHLLEIGFLPEADLGVAFRF